MKDPTKRFSNRVENYVKYRPTYPEEILNVFRDEMGMTESSVIADVGSGTGISAKLFLENGNSVFGVEPNEAMRRAAEEFLKGFPKFTSIDGTATGTNLPDASADLVTAFQAFHWFEGEDTRNEFERILKKDGYGGYGGYVALIWNERQTDSTPFLREYEKFLLGYASDYREVRHENTGVEKLKKFFHKDFSHVTFQNSQIFDFDGLKGRVTSSSYMPAEDSPDYPRMVEELKALFTKYEEQGRITILYDTAVNYGHL
jgi:ubiquinone/menaquinone biosynthesis C-methylase UbiE